ncbi:GntR family transcriptional regulator [Enterococcus timonensis]|uniref:GntR family transcriptional regulator n=1 Tax=Enterococcus timonensis TaxID=1852364 RepID=UPI0008DB13B1|nr:GntR family transcriptional regulator [Enterococcus timonensis]
MVINSEGPNETNSEANNLQEQAYEAIRRLIIHGDLEPGRKVSEKSLEDILKIGRTPVREALIQLRKQKLIYAIPQSGTYVSKIDLKSADNARFAREQLERKIFMETTAKIDDQGKKVLEAILEEQGAAVQRHDRRSFFHLDNVFHQTCFEIAGRSEIWHWLDANNTNLDRFRWLRLSVPDLKWEGIMDQHYALLMAIQERNVDEAEFLAILHLHMMLEEKQAVTEAYPDYFTDESLIY